MPFLTLTLTLRYCQQQRVNIAFWCMVFRQSACTPVDGLWYGHRLDEEIKWDVILCCCALPCAGDAERLLLYAAANERQADYVVAVEDHVEAVIAAHLLRKHF